MAIPDKILSLGGVEDAARFTVPAGEVWAVVGLPQKSNVTVYVNPGAGGTISLATTSSGRVALAAGTHEAVDYQANPISDTLRELLDCSGLTAILVTATTTDGYVEVAG